MARRRIRFLLLAVAFITGTWQARAEDPKIPMETRDAAGLAADLVAEGTPDALGAAEEVLNAVLAAQEVNPADDNYGNFYWARNDKAVEDLNAVEFTLSQLIPMMLHHADRLDPALRQRVLDAIRLGLAEIVDLDVLIAYTNIMSLDVVNSCLGGALLNDAAIADRGRRRLREWIAFTNSNGALFEFNSPTYFGVTLRALHSLATLAPDEDTRVRARTLAARMALSIALRIQPASGRWAGPHSRAYHHTTFCQRKPEYESLLDWARTGALPGWAPMLVACQDPIEIRETSARDQQMMQTSYVTQGFAMGTASRQFMEQSNSFIVHYAKPGCDKGAVAFSRYVINDIPLGRLFQEYLEPGHFYGVQEGNRAIGLYAPPAPQLLEKRSSMKSVIVWPMYDKDDAIWIAGAPVESLPADVPEGVTVVVGTGTIWMAVRPLHRTDLGHDAPIRLVKERDGLLLEIFNYLGPKKCFWNQEWPGPFYTGHPQCGFYAEVAERSAYPDGAAFAAAVDAGALKDECAPRKTYTASGQRPWTIEYARDGRTLGIEADLYEWRLLRRWTHAGDMDWPRFESPVARETVTGGLDLNGARLACGKDAAWLVAVPQDNLYVAGYMGTEPAPLTLEVPGGRVALDAMGMGTVVWHNGHVYIDAVSIAGTPAAEGATVETGLSPLLNREPR